MKTYKTPYDKYGWRIIVKKGKDTTQVYLRSKTRHHTFQKPFYLRLNNENLFQLASLLNKAVLEELKKQKGDGE